MSRLTSGQRKSLPTSAFADPKKRKYPIEDPSHARDALSRVSGNGDAEEKARVRGAVARKFPGILQKRGK